MYYINIFGKIIQVNYVIYIKVIIMKILHISYDYPDDINPNKTVAMKNLVDLSEEFAEDTFYISLNRINTIKSEVILKKKKGIQISTFGLPLGIFFRYTLKRSIQNVEKLNINYSEYDIIHAHKLTFEGPIAYYLFNKYSKKYIISMQQTDFKILSIRWDLLDYYRNILLKCEKIIVVSPWMIKKIKSIFGNRFYNEISSKIVNIPLIVDNKLAYESNNNGRFVTVFHIKRKNLKIKNIRRLLKSIYLLKKMGININLDIIGEGDGRCYIKRKIEKYKLQDNVRLLGKVDNKNIIEILKEYKGFILCSYPETFGMVYIEALQAGIPVIYSEGAGVDGYFDNISIGIKVNPKKIKEIQDALIKCDKNYNYFKRNVYLFQRCGAIDKFRSDSIIKAYNNIMKI